LCASNTQCGIPITLRLKEIKKRRALRGKQTVELLTNSAGKRTVVFLNPSFFYFFNPFFVIGNSWAAAQLQTFGILMGYNSVLILKYEPCKILKF